MKKLLFLLVIAVSLNINAQETIEKTVGEFNTLKVYDLISVKMKKSEENKVVISGRNRNDVQVINKDGKLKIRLNFGESLDGNETVVVLYYTSVEVIDANEGAKVVVEDPIEQFEIDLKTQEGAEITAELKTNYANIRAVTGGIVNATGTSKNQDISIYTGGVYNGEELITEDTEVSISAGGEAYINATEYVEVRIKAGGDVFIYGKPKVVDENRVLGGRIKRM